jgi:hypothetical protein
MAVDTQAVEITINVVDKNSAAAIGQVTKNIEGIGAAGSRVGNVARQAMEQPGIGALSSVEKMRLVTEEAGVRLPRAFLRLAAESKAASAAIGAIGPMLMGIAAIQIGGMIFMQLIEGAKKLYEKWLDVDGAVDRYNQKAAEAAQQEFDKNRSLAQLNVDLNTAVGLVDQLNQKKAQSENWDLGPLDFGRKLNARLENFTSLGMNPDKTYFSMTDANKLNAAMTEADKTQAGLEEKRHEKALREIQDQALIAESKVKAIEKGRIAEKAADDEALENTKNRFNVQNQLAAISERAGAKPGEPGYVPRPGAHDFDEEQKEAFAHAAAERQAAENSQRQSGDTARELRRLQEEADEATLKGIDLLEYKRKAADADWVSEHGQSALAIERIDRIYYAEEAKLADEQAKRIQAMGRAAVEAGDKTLNEALQFGKRVDQMVAQDATRGLSGFARIQADMQARLLQFNREAPASATPADISRGQGAIRAEAGQQSSDLARRNAEETEQLEAQARSKLLSAEKQQTAAIETEYEERLRKFQAELAAQEISQDDYNRRVVAAGQLRDAELAESAERAREKMAGEFNSFFHSLDHPMRALADLGDKVAGQAAAALVQRMQTRFGGAQAAGQTPGGMLGGLFDKIAGAPHAPAAQAPGGAAHATAASAVISLGTAQISIGSASLAFAGGGAALSRAGAGSGPSSGVGSGSTFLLGSGVSGTGSTAGGGWSSGGSTMGAGIGAGIGDVQQGIGLLGQAKEIFGGGTAGGAGVSSGAAGAASAMGAGAASGGGGGARTGSMLGGGGVMANAGGALSGGLGLFNAFEGSGGIGGAAGGALSGMKLGMALGGPIGAGVGAAAGAIIGAIGFGGREKARVYWLKTIWPRIVQDTDSYQQGTMDYTSAYSDMQSTDTQAKTALRKMGSAEGSYYDSTVHPAIVRAEAKLTAEQRAGRSNYTPGAAQFAMGSDYVPQTGMAVLHEGERITPSDQNERITRALESSADSTRRPVQTGFGGDVHLHVSAIDARGVAQFFDQNKHLMRAKINASFAENSGGANGY